MSHRRHFVCCVSVFQEKNFINQYSFAFDATVRRIHNIARSHLSNGLYAGGSHLQALRKVFLTVFRVNLKVAALIRSNGDHAHVLRALHKARDTGFRWSAITLVRQMIRYTFCAPPPPAMDFLELVLKIVPSLYWPAQWTTRTAYAAQPWTNTKHLLFPTRTSL